jgi:hypothetical protein
VQLKLKGSQDDFNGRKLRSVGSAYVLEPEFSRATALKMPLTVLVEAVP